MTFIDKSRPLRLLQPDPGTGEKLCLLHRRIQCRLGEAACSSASQDYAVIHLMQHHQYKQHFTENERIVVFPEDTDIPLSLPFSNLLKLSFPPVTHLPPVILSADLPNLVQARLHSDGGGMHSFCPLAHPVHLMVVCFSFHCKWIYCHKQD